MQENTTKKLTIGELASASGVGVETVRYYQRRGLLPLPPKPYGGIRRYCEDSVAKIRFIKSAQRLGFRLDEIAELLRAKDAARCGGVRALVEKKLHEVRNDLGTLKDIEAILAELIGACHTHHENRTCRIISFLQASA